MLRKRKLLNDKESIFFHITRSIHYDTIACSMAQQRFPDWRFIGNQPGTWIGFIGTYDGIPVLTTILCSQTDNRAERGFVG